MVSLEIVPDSEKDRRPGSGVFNVIHDEYVYAWFYPVLRMVAHSHERGSGPDIETRFGTENGRRPLHMCGSIDITF